MSFKRSWSAFSGPSGALGLRRWVFLSSPSPHRFQRHGSWTLAGRGWARAAPGAGALRSRRCEPPLREVSLGAGRRVRGRG